jgi:hypothetical protein
MLHVPLMEMKKKHIHDYNKNLNFPNNGKLKNVCMIELPICAM